MFLYGDRLILRKSIDADLDFLCGIEADAGLWKYLEDADTSPERIRRIVYDRIHDGSHNFIIQLNDDNQTPIGRMNMWIVNPKNRIWEISYAIFPLYQNKGYCAEALNVLMAFAFDELQAHKVVGTCNEHNKGSSAVMEKAGMTREGVLREKLHWQNRWVDQYCYGILDREYRKRQCADGGLTL